MDADSLERFVEAQNAVYEEVIKELAEGYKRGHWMWFIFPQLSGLGRSAYADRYAIRSISEASKYLKHGVLGARLIACTRLVVVANASSIDNIFEFPDNLKFHSCMTLFANVKTASSIFKDALQMYFAAKQDSATLSLLRHASTKPA